MSNYRKFLKDNLKRMLRDAEYLGMNTDAIIESFMVMRNKYRDQQEELENIRNRKI